MDLDVKTALNAYNFIISEAVDRRGEVTSDDRLRAMAAAIDAYLEFVGGSARRAPGEFYGEGR